MQVLPQRLATMSYLYFGHCLVDGFLFRSSPFGPFRLASLLNCFLRIRADGTDTTTLQ